jgi:hypothetical protein
MPWLQRMPQLQAGTAQRHFADNRPLNR